jgi:thioredoxin 1
MNMEKVVDKFSSRRPGLALLALDSEEEPEAMAALGLERVPTLVVIKKGAIAASRTGLMNPRELETLFDKS